MDAAFILLNVILPFDLLRSGAGGEFYGQLCIYVIQAIVRFCHRSLVQSTCFVWSFTWKPSVQQPPLVLIKITICTSIKTVFYCPKGVHHKGLLGVLLDCFFERFWPLLSHWRCVQCSVDLGATRFSTERSWSMNFLYSPPPFPSSFLEIKIC